MISVFLMILTFLLCNNLLFTFEDAQNTCIIEDVCFGNFKFYFQISIDYILKVNNIINDTY